MIYPFHHIDVRLAPGVAMPQPATPGSAAVDLCANILDPLFVCPQESAILVPTGVRIDMTRCPGLCAVILPRSGLGHKGLVLGNGTGLIDNDYHGELLVSLCNRNHDPDAIITINPGDRIAQLVFLKTETPFVAMMQVDQFRDATNRGEGGFGSTGNA